MPLDNLDLKKLNLNNAGGFKNSLQVGLSSVFIKHISLKSVCK